MTDVTSYRLRVGLLLRLLTSRVRRVYCIMAIFKWWGGAAGLNVLKMSMRNVLKTSRLHSSLTGARRLARTNPGRPADSEADNNDWL